MLDWILLNSMGSENTYTNSLFVQIGNSKAEQSCIVPGVYIRRSLLTWHWFAFRMGACSIQVASTAVIAVFNLCKQFTLLVIKSLSFHFFLAQFVRVHSLWATYELSSVLMIHLHVRTRLQEAPTQICKLRRLSSFDAFSIFKCKGIPSSFLPERDRLDMLLPGFMHYCFLFDCVLS